MITKSEAMGVTVDWAKVERALEVSRTYLVRDRFGHEFYKMYKPSEAQRIFREKGWSGKVVSVLDRSLLRRKS